jgi:hypothetical protein
MAFMVEFGRLAEKILNSIYEVQDEEKVRQILGRELSVKYGLLKSDFDIGKLSNEIID